MAPRKFRHSQAPAEIFSARGWHSGPHADAILLCQKAKKIGGARGPVTFTAKGNDMQNIRLRTATDVLAAIPALLGFVPSIPS